MAVYERQTSGRGQYVEVSLYDTAISLLHPQAANFFMSGKPPVITGNAHPNITPYDAFPTRTKQIFLAVGNDRQFARLAAELGAPELAQDARFRTNQDRRANREVLTGILTRLLAEQDAEPLADRLLAAGVPAGPVQDIPSVVADAHTRHTGMVVEDGAYRGTGTPMKFSRTPARKAEAPHPFSADSRAVLAESGFSAAEIDALIAEGIVPVERRK